MSESTIARMGPATMRLGVRKADGPPQDAMRSLAVSTRAMLEVIGLVTVVIWLTLASVPDLRGPVAQLGSGMWAALTDKVLASPADEDTDTSDADVPRIGQAVVLDPREANVAQYLARRYHVADDAVRVMVAAAQYAGNEHRVDPLLVLAVMAVESSMNPFAQSPVGATGLMQVMPGVHGGKFLDRSPEIGPLDPIANIRVGSEILADVIRRGGSVERGLQLYVGAGNLSDDGGYATRVLAELDRLKLAASGGVAAALAAGMRADTHAVSDAAESASSVPAQLPSAPLARKAHAA